MMCSYYLQLQFTFPKLGVTSVPIQHGCQNNISFNTCKYKQVLILLFLLAECVKLLSESVLNKCMSSK